MSLDALSCASSPTPAEDEIREHLSGHLCRCTGYAPIVEAALAAAEEQRRKEETRQCLISEPASSPASSATRTRSPIVDGEMRLTYRAMVRRGFRRSSPRFDEIGLQRGRPSR